MAVARHGVWQGARRWTRPSPRPASRPAARCWCGRSGWPHRTCCGTWRPRRAPPCAVSTPRRAAWASGSACTRTGPWPRSPAWPSRPSCRRSRRAAPLHPTLTLPYEVAGMAEPPFLAPFTARVSARALPVSPHHACTHHIRLAALQPEQAACTSPVVSANAAEHLCSRPSSACRCCLLTACSPAWPTGELDQHRHHPAGGAARPAARRERARDARGLRHGRAR